MRTDVRLMICVCWRGDASLAETMGRAPAALYASDAQRSC